MTTPAKRPALARIEFITLLLFAAIVVVVIIPKLRARLAAADHPAASNTPKHVPSIP